MSWLLLVLVGLAAISAALLATLSRLHDTGKTPAGVAPRQSSKSARLAAVESELVRGLAETRRAVFQKIRFAVNSARLDEESCQPLDDLARGLLAHPTWRIQIEGHADHFGSREQNRELSLRRAQAIRDYITVKHDVAADRLTALGHGSDRPLPATRANPDDPRMRALNRRVEIIRVD